MMQEYVVWGWKKTMKIISGEANLKFGWLLWDWLCIPYNMLKHFQLKGSLIFECSFGPFDLFELLFKVDDGVFW